MSKEDAERLIAAVMRSEWAFAASAIIVLVVALVIGAYLILDIFGVWDRKTIQHR